MTGESSPAVSYVPDNGHSTLSYCMDESGQSIYVIYVCHWRSGRGAAAAKCPVSALETIAVADRWF